MSANNDSSPATHLGRQMKRDRMAHGWSLRELGARTRTHIGTLSQVENGKRPMTEALAVMCDEVFPERRGWYLSYYEESKSWMPAGFRSWAEYEDRATSLRIWSPGMIHGLLETDGYARELLETAVGATPEMTSTRLASRMQRQQRVLYRDDPPNVWFIVDELSLYRWVGGPDVMAAQMRHLAGVAALPHVVMQVLPAKAHPANASELILTSDAAYVEHLAGGLVFTDQTVNAMERMFSTILSESYTASDSLAIIGRMEQTWNGVRARTARTAAQPVLR
jgi:hypothetical protein